MRLKESDPLFELILGWIMSAEWDMTLTIREAMVKAESLIKAHIENPQGSELSRKCPGIGMFIELPLACVCVCVCVCMLAPLFFLEHRDVLHGAAPRTRS